MHFKGLWISLSSREFQYIREMKIMSTALYRESVIEKLAENQQQLTLKDIKRYIFYISNSVVLLSLRENLLSNKEHIALIIDEYGGMYGITTIEDIIETLLGLKIVYEKDTVSDMQAFARERWKARQTKYNLLKKSTRSRLAVKPNKHIS